MNGKTKLLALILVISLLLPPIVASGTSDVSQAQYWGKVIVTNNGTSNSSICVPFSLSTQTLIDNLMLNSNATDCAIQSASGNDAAFMPAKPGATSWVMYVDSIGESAQQHYYLYTDGVTDGKIRYFPDTGGMTTPYDASILISNNFNYKAAGYFNASVSGNIAHVENAFLITGDGSGNITANIFTIPTNSETLAPNGQGNETALTVSGAASNWQANLTNDGDTSYVTLNNLNYMRDLYTATNTAIGTGVIASVEVHIVATDPAEIRKAKTAIRTNGQTFDGSEISLTPTYIDYSTTYTTNPQSGNIWTWSEVNDMEIGVSLKGENNFGRCTQVYAVVNYYPLISVIASGITSGERTFRVWADGTLFGIVIDEGKAGEISDNVSLSGASIVPNTKNWTSFQNNVMPYVEYQEIKINGEQRQYIEWEYTTGNFTDKSNKGNHAAPTYRVASSDPDISAVLSSFGPKDVSVAPITPPSQATWELITDLPAEPTGLYGDIHMTFPGGAAILAYCEKNNTPVWLIVYPLAFGTAIVLGLVAFALTQGGKIPTRGSLLIQAMVSLCVMIYWTVTGGGVIPAWTILPFGIEALAVIFMRNPERV